jgi:alpha-L-arabinofuranosidase
MFTLLGQNAPSKVTMYYIGNENPWTTLREMSLTPEQVISSNETRSIRIKKNRSLRYFSQVNLELLKDEMIQKASHDSRIVIVIEHHNQLDTLSLPMAESHFCLYNSHYFRNEVIYNQIIKHLIKEDHKLKRMYQAYERLRFSR